jgi:16S rRNA (cytosine1402-N4)-methyltransferase
VDCTLGAGGHFCEILKTTPSLKQAVGCDQDKVAIDIATQRINTLPNIHFGASDSNDQESVRVDIFHANFSFIQNVLESEFNLQHAVDMMLFDLGCSSMQFDDPERGFSYSRPGPLDMRMNGSLGESAAQLIDRLSVQDLEKVLRFYGDEKEKDSIRLAKEIKLKRGSGELETTWDLSALCSRVLGKRQKDPAMKTFQALRIAVNDEVQVLSDSLTSVPSLMSSGGRLGIISFHSLECKIALKFMREWEEQGIAKMITKKAGIVADRQEVVSNPRSRSARLRVCEFWRPSTRENEFQ